MSSFKASFGKSSSWKVKRQLKMPIAPSQSMIELHNMSLKLFLFGPPRIEQNGRSLALNLRNGQALLAYLAVEGKKGSRDDLAASKTIPPPAAIFERV
jgi:hypothetical protein